MEKPYWGVDLGGTKIEVSVFHFDNKSIDIIDRRRVPTEASKGYKHIINQVNKVINETREVTGLIPKHIGFSTPGTVEPSSGLMKNCNTIVMNGQPMLADLIQSLSVPVTLTNDANCFALAEAKMGIVPDVVPDAKVVFGVIMGSGCGGGVVVNGQVIGGLHGIGGEWGHNFLDESGGDCYCGCNGCVENIISGTALQNYYETTSGQKRNMKEIVEAYRAGTDPIAEKTMLRLFSMFGKAISVIINILDPDAIVIGGGLGNIDELYTHGVSAVKEHIFNKRVVNTPFLKPKLGDSAGVFGAALAGLNN